MAGEINRPEPIWKGLFSVPVGVAILAACGFWFTTNNPDNLSTQTPNQADKETNNRLNSELLFEDVAKTEAAKLFAAGKNSEAIQEANQELSKSPFDVVTLVACGNVLVQAGDKAQQAEGLKHLLKSIYLCPQSRYVRLNYARQLVHAKRFKENEAPAQYKLLMAKSPGWTTPFSELGDLYLETNDPQKAVEQFEHVTQNDTNNGTAQKKLGLAMAAADDANEKAGFEEFIKGYTIEQKQGIPADLAAYLKRFGDDKAKAEETLKKEAGNDFAHPDKLVLLGELYASENKLHLAKELLIPAAKSSDDIPEPDVFVLLAEVLHDLKDDTGAEEQFKTAAQKIRPDVP